MYPVSARFLDTITGSHRATVRVQVLPPAVEPQLGPNPVGGVELPLVDGDIKLTSQQDVNGTLSLEISGDYWDLLQPYGAELFVERGIDYGDGTRELVPCGYYGIEEISQDQAPAGPVHVVAADRSRRLQRNRVIFPIQFASGTSHRTMFERLVNGITPEGAVLKNYGMFLYGEIPIIWSGYDPDDTKIRTSVTCEDDAHAFLQKIADAKGCVLRFDRHGQLRVERRNIAPDATPIYDIKPGPGGNLIGAARKVTREGVYNYVVARGSDPANPTGNRLAVNDDEDSPLRWYGPFGAVVRYYASPLILSNDAADAAAETVLARYKGLPSALSLLTVPNPALDPLDVVSATIGARSATHLIDSVTIPLVGSQAPQIVTRTLFEIPIDEEIGGGSGGFPNPTDPGFPGGPGGPVDGVTTAASRFGWGVPVREDQFTGAGVDTAQWTVLSGPGQGGNGTRSPVRVTVQNGLLVITGLADGVTGALTHKFTQQYGRWEVRARAVNTGATGATYHPTLAITPASGKVPTDGLYNFLETTAPAATTAAANIYYPQTGTSTPPPGGGGGGTPGGGRTAGPGGVATPAGATLTTSDSSSLLTISSGGTASAPRVYDGQGHSVGRINITTSNVVVQNFRINANSQYGVLIDDVNNVTLQNCDIKGVRPSGDGDLNAITAFGNNIKILYNTMIDFVSGDPGGSHTDGIQTWISDSHPVSSSNWEIIGNIMRGPHNPNRSSGVPSIHQCIMQEGPGRGGNSGGSGTTPTNWLVADNTFLDSWNQCLKFDGISGVKITRNKFEGSSSQVIDDYGGVTFYSDNVISGDYDSVGISITSGNGPANPYA